MSDDGEDSEAISFSEGRRTPLPPVEDENEDEEVSGSRPGSKGKQAMFYTPEASNSPVTAGFQEKHNGAIEPEERDEPVHEHELENERLPSPPLQVVSA
jgi:hypothetical protein